MRRKSTMNLDEGEGEAFLPSAPPLHPQRLAINVKKSSKKLDEHDDKKAKTPSASSSALAQVASWVRNAIASLKAGVKRPQRYPALVNVCVGCLVVLCGLAVCTLYWFSQRNAIASRWARLMETSGFVDWPPLRDPSFLPTISAVMSTIIAALSLVVVPWSLLTGSEFGMKLFRDAMITVFVVGTGLVILTGGTNFSTSIDGRYIEALAAQADSVANFNRVFCQAWCRESEAGLAAFVRGECGVKMKTDFDQVLEAFDAKEWCLQALTHQNFELVAEYSGVSPFAGLKGAGGVALTNMRPETPLLACLWAALIPATALLALFLDDIKK